MMLSIKQLLNLMDSSIHINRLYFHQQNLRLEWNEEQIYYLMGFLIQVFPTASQYQPNKKTALGRTVYKTMFSGGDGN